MPVNVQEAIFSFVNELHLNVFPFGIHVPILFQHSVHALESAHQVARLKLEFCLEVVSGANIPFVGSLLVDSLIWPHV